MSYNEQFKMARLPIKPLAYEDKAIAQTRELLIDYSGDNPTYNIYIVDPKDRTKIINITQLIINQGFPNINGDNIKISINNELNPIDLRDIINQINDRYLYPEDNTGFNYSEDKDKLFDPASIGIMLRDNQKIYLPVTTADKVFGSDGRNLEQMMQSMTRLGFSTACVRATIDNQVSFDIDYPFDNYLATGNMIELRIGSTYIDKARYYITENLPNADGKVTGAKITLIDESLEIGRAINLLFIFNASALNADEIDAISGRYIANGTIPIVKMEKYSDRYDLNDPTSVASSKAIYNLFSQINSLITNYSPMCIYTTDIGSSTSSLSITATGFNVVEGCCINVRTIRQCKPTSIYVNGIFYSIIDSNTNTAIDSSIPAGKTIKLIYSSYDKKFYVTNLLGGDYKLTTNKWLYTAKDADNVIPFSGLSYNIDDEIFVYKNGNRLFEMVDYSLDISNEVIYMFTRAETGDRFMFETYNVERR